MVALQRFGTGESPVASAKLNLIVDALTGAGNTPVNHGGVNDAVQYALSVRNQDPAGKAVILYAPNGTTVLLQVTAAGVLASPDGVVAAAPVLTTAPGRITGSMLAGSTVTADKLSLTSGGAVLGADVALPANTNTLVLSAAVPATGSWLLTAGVAVTSATAGTVVSADLQSVSTGYRATSAQIPNAGGYVSLFFAVIATLNATDTAQLRVQPNFAATAKANDPVFVVTSTYINMLRVG